MKKPLIVLLVLMFSTQSQAVYLSSTGMGEVLIFPYFTVNNDFNSLINLVNTTNQAKAVRVRFREAANSREVFAFNLYLGPHDAWTGALIKGDESEQFFTKIISADNSCTMPSITFSGQLFNKNHYIQSMSDSYGDDVNRMHEGFVEVIEMGVITGDSAEATVIGDNPAHCSVLNDAWDSSSNNAYWLTDPSTDMLPPSGGLLGNLLLIEVSSGIAVTEEPTVLNNFSDEILHYAVASDSPNLSDGNTVAQIETDGQVATVNWATGFEAVSSVLMKSSIFNEYVLTDSIGANTDWVITLPTRQFHLDTQAQGNTDHLAPFTVTNSTTINCEVFSIKSHYSREEQISPPPLIIVPQGFSPPMPALCYATNNITLYYDMANIEDGIIYGSRFNVKGLMLYPAPQIVDFRITSAYREGWIGLGFPNNPTNSQELSMSNNSVDISGLPIIGFSTQRYVNHNLSGGVLANYAALFEHKSKKNVILQTSVETQSGMHLSKDNVGQVLLFPYYTVRNGINTLISVVNTTDKVKALKIRFNEGKNGREVLDFNLYIGPYDVWTAGLVGTTSNHVQGYEGQNSVKLLTSDSSCTLPGINGQEFLPYAYTGAFDDGQGDDLERVQEGFFEIIEMGTVVGPDAVAATHNSAGIPNNCGAIISNWAGGAGQWSINPSINMVAPDGSGFLYGSASLIDVAEGVDMSYDATAIVGFSTEIQHHTAGNLLPNLSSGTELSSLIESDSGLIKVNWDSSLDAVSSLFMQAQVTNDFVIETIIGAQTEWINTFPTKVFYVDPLYSNTTVTLPPFHSVLTDGFGACEQHRFKAFDRDQKPNISAGSVIIGLPPPNFSIYPEDCWSVVVSDVNKDTDDNTIFDSQLNLNDFNSDNQYTSVHDLPFTTGWMQIDFVDEILNPGKLIGTNDNGEMVELFGKPVLGFVAQKYIGTLGAGVLANYAVANMNKGHTKLVVSSANKK